MLDSNGDSGEPCGTPCSVLNTTPSGSTTLALSIRPISTSSRRSLTCSASLAASRWWQTRSKNQLMSLGEGHCDLLELPGRLLGAEVDGGAHRDRPQVPGLLDGAVHHLVELVGVGQQLVVVELDDEGDLVRPLPRHRTQHAEGGGHRVAAALDGQLDDLPAVEVDGVGGERSARGVLDALVHGEDRDVARAAQAAVLEDRLEAAEDARGAVADRPDPVDEVRSGQVELVAAHRLAAVLQQVLRVLAENLFYVAQGGCRRRCHVVLREGAAGEFSPIRPER